jgi:transcription factor Ssl1
MGFPQRAAEGSISICSCHKESKVGEGYICPRCKARVCELPTECRICGLTLVSSPHLARSYHHLFPIAPFDEVKPSRQNEPHRRSQKTCFGCQQSLVNPGELYRCGGFAIVHALYTSLFMTMHAYRIQIKYPDSDELSSHVAIIIGASHTEMFEIFTLPANQTFFECHWCIMIT